MKVLRAVFSLLIGFAISYFLAVTFFNYSEYSSKIDRFFLTCVPALAIGILLFEAFPAFQQWLGRVQARYSFAHYFFGFLLSLIFAYGAVGFLSDVLKTSFSVMISTAIFITIGSVCGYYLVRRAARSFRGGFLSKPLNLILALRFAFAFGRNDLCKPAIPCDVCLAIHQRPAEMDWLVCRNCIDCGNMRAWCFR